MLRLIIPLRVKPAGSCIPPLRFCSSAHCRSPMLTAAAPFSTLPPSIHPLLTPDMLLHPPPPPSPPQALSNLSPWLHFGQLAPQRAALEAAKMRPKFKESVEGFLEELVRAGGLKGIRVRAGGFTCQVSGLTFTGGLLQAGWPLCGSRQQSNHTRPLQ